MMEIRHFSNEFDRQQSISLRKYVFHSVYSNQKAKDYNCLLDMADKIGVFEDKNLLGQVLNLPISINFYGEEVAAVGINHVGVYPENRGQGIASLLMLDSLKTANKCQQVLAILQPFSPAFYRHFGYDLFTERLNYKIPVSNYPKFKKQTEINIVRKVPGTLSAEEIGQLQAEYDRFAYENHGAQIRDNTWWIRHDLQYPDLNYALAYKENEVVGYVSYRLEGTTIEVIDFIYQSNLVRQQLWGFLAAHQANVFNIVGTSTTNHQISYDFDDPRIEQKIWLDTMVRIVNVESFLKLWLKIFPNDEVSLEFSLFDSKAPWNSGVYKISSGSVNFIPGGSEMKNNRVSLQQLTAIFLGPLNEKQLMQYLNPELNSTLMSLIELAENKEVSHFLGEF